MNKQCRIGKQTICSLLLVGIVLHGGCNSSLGPNVDSDFVPAEFPIPQGLVHEEFELRPLKVSDAEADYDAVLESKVELRALLGGEWPPDGFTMEQNRSDLIVHQQAFRDRESFTYTVTATNGKRILGCVYVLPAEDADAQVYYWIRTSEHGRGLSESLQMALKDWLASEWGFVQVEFHGGE
ncbi:MAG: GNAT family protein [Pirellulaceae bacterium]|nr:GNAT family N-acetyltransferase [Planctomycetales bacterium]